MCGKSLQSSFVETLQERTAAQDGAAETRQWVSRHDLFLFRSRLGSVHRDPLSRYVAGTVADDVSVGVILVHSKSSGITVVIAV
jgi:hypothetical protein